MERENLISPTQTSNHLFQNQPLDRRAITINEFTPRKTLSSLEINTLLLSNTEILTEILSTQRRRRNRNFINHHVMELIYQYEQNLIKLGVSLKVSEISDQQSRQNFLDTLRKMNMRKRSQK